MKAIHLPTWRTRPDLLAVVLVFGIALVTRLVTLSGNSLSWDVFGYYLYLPATFIHHDPFLTDLGWVRTAQEQYGTTDTLYQITSLPDGSSTYFFLMGTAVFYLPFFLIGHAYALFSSAPADGFSMPYQIALTVGCMTYTLTGLLVLDRVLMRFFRPRAVTAVILIIALGTSWFDQNTIKVLETANILFLLLALLLWWILRWHEGAPRRYLIGVAACIAAMTLVKPSEILFVLVPVLWMVHDRRTLQEKLRLIGARWRDLVLATGVGIMILLPQLIIWKLETGSWIFDSYVNPGVGIDWRAPHAGAVLFSFRKGWLIYTPLMALALAGFLFLWKDLRRVFWAVLVPFLVSFHIIASWSEWWYGGSFSCRPLVTDCVLLAFPLGCTMDRIIRSTLVFRIPALVIITALIGLNLFQIWQHEHGVLDPSRNTMAYYFAVFGKTAVPPGARDLLLVERTGDGAGRSMDAARYDARPLEPQDFEHDTAGHGHTMSDTARHGRALRLDNGYRFSPAIETPFDAVTTADHFRAHCELWLNVAPTFTGEMPCLVMTMEREEGVYGYRSFCLPDTFPRGRWTRFAGDYLTPEIREATDRFKTYVWHRGDGEVTIDDVRVTLFTPKQ